MLFLNSARHSKAWQQKIFWLAVTNQCQLAGNFVRFTGKYLLRQRSIHWIYGERNNVVAWINYENMLLQHRQYIRITDASLFCELWGYSQVMYDFYSQYVHWIFLLFHLIWKCVFLNGVGLTTKLRDSRVKWEKNIGFTMKRNGIEFLCHFITLTLGKLPCCFSLDFLF